MVADDLLASDAEREHVLDLLQRAVGQGMLDLDEFSERADVVVAARTRSELNSVLFDLPSLLRTEPLPSGEDDVLVLRGTLTEIVRRGAWRVPARILLTCRLGTTRLDFTSARLPASTVHVELAVTGGSVELIVPATASVDTSGVRVTRGHVHDRRRAADTDDGPRFVLSGRVRAGEVRVHRPRLFRFSPRMSGLALKVVLRSADRLVRRLTESR
jgi:hypothetical protein